MKRIWMVLLLVLLAGCSAPAAMETVTDVWIEPTMGKMQQVVVELPQDMAIPVMQDNEAGSLYICEDYVLTVAVYPGGDLAKTLSETTGFSPEMLQLVRSQQEDNTRYECVWTAVGEGGNQVGRVCILDDGMYHYVLTALAPEQKSGELQEGTWQSIFRSFRTVEAGSFTHTGS